MRYSRALSASLRLALAVLVALPGLVGPLLGGEPVGAAGDGIAVGKRFAVPIVVGGKSVNGRAVVNADRTLVILFPSADGLSVEELVYSLARQDSPPEPQPPQPPQPPGPTPGPVTKPTRMVVVYESRNAPTAVAAVATANSWRAEAKKLGIAATVADPDQLAGPNPGMLSRANKVGLPAVLFMDDAGLVVAAEKLPATADALTALVKKQGGAK